MEERKATEDKHLREIAEKFPGQFLGHFTMKDGKLDPEQERYLREKFTKLLEEVEPDEAKRAEAKERLEDTLRGVQKDGAIHWQLGVNIAKAKHALERMEEGLLELCEKYAMTQDSAHKVYQLGQTHGLLSSGLAAIAGALERLDHVLNCTCGGEAHADEPSERPTDPPADVAAAEQEASA